MSTLYVTQQDTVLRKTDERLKVTQKGTTLLDVPMLKVSQVVLCWPRHRHCGHPASPAGAPYLSVLLDRARALYWPV